MTLLLPRSATLTRLPSALRWPWIVIHGADLKDLLVQQKLLLLLIRLAS